MTMTSEGRLDERILVLAPTQRDSETTREILKRAGIAASICNDLKNACDEIERGCGAALLTQEFILQDVEGTLARILKRQPHWSDLPVLVLTPAGIESAQSLQALEAIGHMTLIRRPVAIQSLVSTIRGALRDRQRQYAARDYFVEREQYAEALRQKTAELRQLADAMPQIVWSAGPDGLPDYYNQRWFEFTGLSEDDPAFETWQAIVHPDDFPRFQETWRESVRTGKPFQIESRFRERSTGEYRWHLGRALPVLDRNGRVVKWFGTCTDIDDQKHAAEAADHRTRQVQRLADIFMRLNAVHDLSSVTGIVTNEARDLIGARFSAASVSNERDQGKILKRVSVSEKDDDSVLAGVFIDWSEVFSVFRNLKSPVRMSRAEVADHPEWQNYARKREPKPAPRSWLAAPLFSRAGSSIGAIQLTDGPEGDFTDNDEAILAQIAQMGSAVIENVRLYDELRENDRRKDEFLAMLAHELRNPLAAINNAVRISSMSKLREQIDWSLDVMSRQIRNLTRLIDDLLDVSRITRGKIHLHKEIVDACPILKSAIEAVRPLIEERKHELSVSYRPGLWVEADPTRLEQIFVNLLANAAKYTDGGGRIGVTAQRSGDEIVVKIRDTGVGIPAESLSKMFELFAQADRTLARSEGGLGIGLTIVRSLAEMHNGSVTAASEGLGKGSEFTLRFPAVPIAKSSDGGRLSPSAKLPAHPTTAGSDRSIRILIVDDHLDTAQGMEKLLKLLGHEVLTVHDGPSAIEAALKFRPDFVLLDIGLPGMDGYQVAAGLRKCGLRDTVIVAISGYGQDEDRRRSRAAGFDHHLVKPIDCDALLGVLARNAT